MSVEQRPASPERPAAYMGVDIESCLEGDDWVPYSQREEWKDVQPIPLKELEGLSQPIVRIAYSDRFKEVYDYLRAVIAKGESSERAFRLTTDAVLANPANYSAWYYRRNLLKYLSKDLNVELEFISQVILANPKNYQVWEHRRAIVDWMKDISKEADFLRAVFEQDNKNYHAWQYRQWYLITFNAINKAEIDFVDSMISKDVRNNSAWNHRFFVIKNQGEARDEHGRQLHGFADSAVKEREVDYALNYIAMCTDNESAWNYLRGVIDDSPYSDWPQLVSFCKSKYEENHSEVFVLEMLMEIYAEELKQKYALTETVDAEIMTKFSRVVDEIIVADPIREKYWRHFGHELLKSLEQDVQLIE